MHLTFSTTAAVAILFMGIIVGQVQSLAPDYAKVRRSDVCLRAVTARGGGVGARSTLAAQALSAAKRLYVMISEHEELQGQQRNLPRPPIQGAPCCVALGWKWTVLCAFPSVTLALPFSAGQLEFKHVAFSYPTRPEAVVLSDFNLAVSPGETVALVGSSGCGKSTVIALVEQFYTPNGGSIEIDGHPLVSIDAAHVRQHLALVSQQPELFALTIAENIAYGLPADSVSQAYVWCAEVGPWVPRRVSCHAMPSPASSRLKPAALAERLSRRRAMPMPTTLSWNSTTAMPLRFVTLGLPFSYSQAQPCRNFWTGWRERRPTLRRSGNHHKHLGIAVFFVFAGERREGWKRKSGRVGEWGW